jgi:hypothetical protein
MSNNWPIVVFKGEVDENARHRQETHDREAIQLQSGRNHLENRVIQILSLPNELLSIIFEHGHLHSPSCGSLPFEIVVSHLNRRFRAIAISTRLLWIKIEISLTTPFDKVMAYLKRSGTSAIELSVNIDAPGPASEYNSRSAALLYTCAGWATVMPEMIRCHNVDFV